MNQEFKDIVIGIKRSLSLVEKSEKTFLVLATVLMLVSGILTNLPALILGKLVDSLTFSPNISFITTLPFILLIILIIAVRETLTIIRKYIVENIATQTEKKQTVYTIDHLLKADLTSLSTFQIGSLQGRIFRSIQGLVRMLKLSFLDFLPTFFTAVAAIVIALIQKPLIASMMILVIPTSLYIIYKQISSQKGIRVLLLRGKEKIDGAVVEMLSGIETIRVLNTNKIEVKKVANISEQLRQIEIRHHLIMALFDSSKYLVEGFCYILVISLSIYLSTTGIISRGDILVYSILFLSITGPLREIHRILDQAHEGSILVNDLNDLQTQPLDISFQNDTTQISNNPTIKIADLSFHYPQKPNQVVLKNLNLEIKLGENIGIAGASGCGKTTLIKILLRLAHGFQGQIELFEENLLNLSREDISAKIAYLPQKTYIFSGTIRDNILYGIDHQVTETELVQACQTANIYQEIISALGGFSGKVTENGNNLSGGQKQRLALARLMLTNPQLIIFDEATSALDNTNEAIIQTNIERVFKNKTTITIAHRLSTLKNCDRILVFDKGEIVQEGTYQKLAKTKGLFQNFLTQIINS